MAPTTRSRGGSLAAALSTDSPKDVDIADTVSTKSSKPAENTAKNDKVYRKAAPKAEPQQRKFPSRRTTVRPKKSKSSNKRLSLPNPSTSSGRKGRKRVDDEEDRKQKTLTQMRWVPSSYPSGDETLDGEDDEVEGSASDVLAGVNEPEASGAPSESKNKAHKTKAKKAAVKKSTNKGRKRRKTTGDLELELEREDGDDNDNEVSSSKFHTQTLTQMPSWHGLVDMVVDSDEDPGLDFGDDLPRLGGGDEGEARGDTPPSKKRKRPTPSPPPAGFELAETALDQTSAPNLDMSHAPPPPAPESTNPSVVPETPHHPRVMCTEIPSSQPSPFTPNLEASLYRFLSPLNHGIDRRSPLKERSTNVDAPAPTPSALRKRTRSEIPDSWSTVNGGMPSSGAGTGVKRTPLKEMHFADYSIELGESSHRLSQRTAADVVMDSDDEFEGLSEDEIEAPGTPTPAVRASGQADEMSVTEAPRTSHNATPDEQRGGSPEVVLTSDDEELVAATPAEQVTVPEDITSRGLPPDKSNQRADLEIEERQPEVVTTPTPAPPARSSTTEEHVYRSGSHQGSICASSAEVAGTPVLSVPKISTLQSASHSSVQRNATPEPSADEDDTEAETPSRPRRRPSSSSAVDKDTPISSPHKTSPAMPPVSQLAYTQLGYTQLGNKSQAFESQRVPFEVIRQWAPQTDRSDVIVSVDFDEVKHIVEGRYSHLFRDLRIPGVVQRIWMYITAPVFQLKYMASISDFKLPDDMEPHHAGMGIAEFREKKGTKYAYELLQVYQLNNPVPLDRMREEGWVEQTPSATHFTYVPPAPLGALLGNLRCALFEETSDESQTQEATTVSQELAQQLRSDIEHSTQLHRELLGSLSPPAPLSQPLKRPQRSVEDLAIPSSQDAALAPEDRLRATPKRTKFTSAKEVVFAKPKIPPPPQSSRSKQTVEDLEDDEEDFPHSRVRHPLYPSQQRIVKSTVRPSQATTLSAPPTPSQRGGEDSVIEYCTIPDSSSPVRPSATIAASSGGRKTVVIDDSPIPLMRTSSGPHHTQSSLGLGALLASSQGIGLADMRGEDDSLMDDSRIKMPPKMEDLQAWDEDDDDEM